MAKSKYNHISIAFDAEQYRELVELKAKLSSVTGMKWSWANMIRDSLKQYVNKKNTALNELNV